MMQLERLAAALAPVGALGARASQEVPGTAADFPAQCAAFAAADAGIAGATVTNHAFVAAGANVALVGNEACGLASQPVAVDLCRVSLRIATSRRSAVVAEVWMPRDWNGRLVKTGNGGLSGCVDYAAIAYTTKNGFASVGTNNGKNGSSGLPFLNNPEVVNDFAWRAVHVGVEAGKALVRPFYGAAAAAKSYMLGCSLGGRQAIQAADRFPADFDGIVAGCPAVDFNSLYSWRARFFPLTGSNTSAAFIPAAVWKGAVHAAVLQQCDALDGVVDGIIEDPSLCAFDPAPLLCGAGSCPAADAAAAAACPTAACLTAAQADVVRAVFAPYTWANGTVLYPAMNPGSEVLAADGLYGGAAFAASQEWFRYAVHGDPAWDPAAFALADAAAATAADPGGIRTWPRSLAAFRARGGRALLLHGGQDQQISSFGTPRFYEHLRAGMGLARAQMDGWLRFFRVSGMAHCNGGPGAWVVGQQGGAAAQGPFDAQHNVLAALVDWVEKGIAPDTITGTKYVNDTASLGVAFRRNHCRWPLRNTYLGEGKDAKDAASWQCKPVPSYTAGLW